MPTEPLPIRSACRRPRRPAAFTLTELLIVMAVIVLALALAVPAIRALTGTKSEQAAQNTVSAFLVRARTEAIGLQKVEGVLFYVDPGSGRVTCAQVVEVPATLAERTDVVYLDLVADHDTLAVAPGIRVFTMKDLSPIVYMNDRYLGFNSYLGSTVMVGGVILFDAEGRTISRGYGLHLVDVNPTTGARSQSALAQLLQCNPTPQTDWPLPSTTQLPLHSQLGMVLVNYDDLKAAGLATGTTYTDANDPPQVQSRKEIWIDQNATPIFINRYNGTLTRAE